MSHIHTYVALQIVVGKKATPIFTLREVAMYVSQSKDKNSLEIFYKLQHKNYMF